MSVIYHCDLCHDESYEDNHLYLASFPVNGPDHNGMTAHRIAILDTRIAPEPEPIDLCHECYVVLQDCAALINKRYKQEDTKC